MTHGRQNWSWCVGLPGNKTCENRTCENWPSPLSCAFSWALENFPWALENFPWALSWEFSWGSSGAFCTEQASTFVGISVDIFVYTLVAIFVSTFVRVRGSNFAVRVLCAFLIGTSQFDFFGCTERSSGEGDQGHANPDKKIYVPWVPRIVHKTLTPGLPVGRIPGHRRGHRPKRFMFMCLFLSWNFLRSEIYEGPTVPQSSIPRKIQSNEKVTQKWLWGSTWKRKSNPKSD